MNLLFSEDSNIIFKRIKVDSGVNVVGVLLLYLGYCVGGECRCFYNFDSFRCYLVKIIIGKFCMCKYIEFFCICF